MGMFIHRRKVEMRNLAKEQPKVEAKKESKEESGITKDDVAKLPFFKLKSLAKTNGLEVDGKDGKTLKKELIEKLGL